MIKNKIIDSGFSWSVQTKLPGPSSSMKETAPLLWLGRLGSELFLVNSSDETLDEVSAHSGGTIDVGDGAASLGSKLGYFYQNIPPNHAVKVDEYDDYYDLDYLIQVYIRICSKTLGKLEIMSPLCKGGIKRNTVLLWDIGKPGKDVIIKEISI